MSLNRGATLMRSIPAQSLVPETHQKYVEATTLPECWSTQLGLLSYLNLLNTTARGWASMLVTLFASRKPVYLFILFLSLIACKWAPRDDPSARTLHHLQERSDTVTVEKCLDACLAQDFALAGLEYGSECCSNIFPRRQCYH
jgi:hypothetical protein